VKLDKTQKRFIRKHHQRLSVAQIARRLKLRPADVEHALGKLGLQAASGQHQPDRPDDAALEPTTFARLSDRLAFLDRYGVAFAIVVGLALALRLVHLVEVADTPFFRHLHTDPSMYNRWAVKITEGDWLGRSKPVFYLGPLYPYFLAVIYSVVGASKMAACLVQIILSALSAGLVYHLGRQLSGTVSGLIAGLLAAFCGMLIFFSSLILGATLIIFLDLLMLVLLVSGLRRPTLWKWIVAGVCFGLSACGRGNVALFGPLAVLAILAGLGFSNWKKWLPACAAFTIVFFLTISPVTLHNRLVGEDSVLLTSNAGANLFIGNNAHSRGIYMKSARYKDRPMGLSVRDQNANFPEVARRELRRDDLKPSEISRFWVNATVKEIRADFGRWLKLEGNKLKYLLNAYELPNNRNYYFSQRFSTLLRLPLVTYGVILPLAVAGLIISSRRWREHGILFAFVLAHVAGLLLFFILARYRLILVPVLFIYTGIALAWICQNIVTSRRRWLAALTVVLLIPGYAMVYQKVPRTNYRANYINLANAHRDLGQLEEALENYDRALAVSPNYYYAYFKKGEVLARLGRRQEARDLLDRALTFARRNNDELNVRRIERQLRKLDAE